MSLCDSCALAHSGVIIAGLQGSPQTPGKMVWDLSALVSPLLFLLLLLSVVTGSSDSSVIKVDPRWFDVEGAGEVGVGGGAPGVPGPFGDGGGGGGGGDGDLPSPRGRPLPEGRVDILLSRRRPRRRWPRPPRRCRLRS